MDTITINLKKLNEDTNLSLKQYLDLQYLYIKDNVLKSDNNFIEAHGGEIDYKTISHLEDEKYIKYVVENNESKIYIREKTRILFEGSKDLFYTWLLGFPIKTPSGRYLSPKGENTVAGKKLRKKWKKLFGSDTLIQQRVIDILAVELKWRKDNGKIEYMHNAETWLNQGDWEKYEYLLEEQESKLKKQNEDFI